MIVEIADGETWEYAPPSDQTIIAFASASAPAEPVLSVYLNDELVERVYLKAPHSWWTATNQSICGKPVLEKTDRLRIAVLGGSAAVRIDLDES